ncbi:hypothetical protein LOZ66_004251 [Ophidiomyces ophidiicola]|nr:hypothetical protein LOZ66_004251 [Ophidiomyces ophidiicola]
MSTTTGTYPSTPLTSVKSTSGRPRVSTDNLDLRPQTDALDYLASPKPKSIPKQQKNKKNKMPPSKEQNDFSGGNKGMKSEMASDDDTPSSALANLDQEDCDENEEEEDDDDEDEPAAFAPSYGTNTEKNRKAGHRLGTSVKKGRKSIATHGDYDRASDEEYCSGSVSSVSSVSGECCTGSADSDAEYDAVDFLSDGDDEDLEVEKFEEQWIVGEFRHGRPNSVAGLRGFGDEWSGFDDLEHRPLYSAGSFFDEDQIMMPNTSNEMFNAEMASENFETPVPRRVHFMESDDSSDSSSEDELLSDFLQQESLDPDLRRLIENDGCRNPLDFQVDNAFYEIPSNIYHVESDSDVGSSSGYETDGGETTDEEDYPPPATITHPRSILRRESSVSVSAGDEDNTQTQLARRRGPLRGTFIADPNKPVAVMAPNGKQLILIPPYASYRHDWLETATNSLANTATNSPRATNNAEDSDTDLVSPSRPDFSPMLSSAANLMMTALSGNDAGGEVTGPPEAFYPNGKYLLDPFEDDDDDEDSESALNVNDFINFGDASSDGETDKMMDDVDSPFVTASVDMDFSRTPTGARESPLTTNAERLLNHLDRGIVTAFRRNHNRYQALIRLPQHREFMPANSPSRPASVFRRSRATDGRTPPRKRKASNYLGGEAVRRKVLDSHRRSSTAA